MKAKLSILAGFAVGGALLYFAFRGIDFRRLLEIARGADYRYFVPLTFSIWLGLFARGIKWKLLLDPIKPVRAWDAFRLEAAGIALNNVLPLRLGEVARGTTAAGVFGIPVATAFSSIVVERALDIVLLIIMLGLVAAAGGVSGGFLDSGPYLWLVFGGVLAGIAGLIFADAIMEHRFFAGTLRRFPRAKRLLSQLALGVKALHSPASGLKVFTAGLVQWGLEGFNFYLVACAFGLEAVLTPLRCVVLLFTAAVACSVPGMPGFFGNYEASIAAVAASWGVPGETALAYAMLGHVFGYLVVTLTGIFFVYQMGSSLGRVWAQFGSRSGEGKA